MKQIQDSAAFFFLAAVALLAAIAVLGVWGFFSHDVITKAFETLGLLAFVAVVVMVAGRFIESKPADGAAVLPHAAFRPIRRITLGVLIASASILALLGVLTIWEVIQDKDILFKSLSSLAILAFSTFVMVMTCLEREKSLLLEGRGKAFSIGGAIGIIFLGYLLVNMLSLFTRF